MRRLTDIMKEIKESDDTIMESHSLTSYMKNHIGGIMNSSSMVLENNLESLKNKLSERAHIEISEPVFHAQEIIPIYDDEKLTDFVFILDCISAFGDISELYKENPKNDNNWYGKEVIKAIKNIQDYVDQLALCITPDADEIQAELNMNPDDFDSKKELATIIKSMNEYKKFKKLIKKRIDFSSQPINIRALCTIIQGRCKDLVEVLK